MEADELLHFREGRMRIVRQGAIVKPQEEALKLRNDSVFIVARIPNQGSAGISVVAGQVLGWGIAAADGIAQQKGIPAVVHIRVVVPPPSLNVVQVKRSGAKVDQGIGMILFFLAA